MNMRGWRRLGVVLSVIWFIGFGLWLREADYDSARKIAGYENCGIIYDLQVKRYAPELSDQRALVTGFSDCLNRAGARYVAPPWWGIIVADVLSIALIWLLAWIIVRVGRWVAVGFRT